VAEAEQVLVTAAVPEDIPEILKGAHFKVSGGTLTEVPCAASEENESGRTSPATEDEPGAAGAVPGLRPGEGVMEEGLPHAWGGHRGGHPPGGNNAP
jgi:hypothetical protein